MNQRPSARTPAAQRIPRRLMLTVATFCALGLLLSLLIAAICAVWIPIRGPTRSLYATDPQAPPLLASLGPLPAHWNAPHSLSIRGRAGITTLGASGTLSPDVSMSGAFLATRIEAGFPARCLVARRLWDSEAGDLSAGPWRSGVVLGPAWRPWTHDPRRYNSILPIRPLAAGLAVNTLAWGAALWLIFRGSRLARRHWRLRRGRCPNCGYPRPEDPAPGPHPCPECGAELILQMACTTQHRVPHRSPASLVRGFGFATFPAMKALTMLASVAPPTTPATTSCPVHASTRAMSSPTIAMTNAIHWPRRRSSLPPRSLSTCRCRSACCIRWI